ncbi:MAG TPA: glycosyltransferase [Bryobacteraceae bacterium]|nr:glycosyltransferase [Bryobacteraceae bacterium]
MSRSLHIAITADPYVPVPPRLYGGIERVLDFLVRGLAERGHRVTLFAHPESTVPAALVPYGSPPHFHKCDRARELWQVGAKLWARRHQFDLVHSFGRLAALAPVLAVRGLPKIQSYQRDGLPWKSIRAAHRLASASIRFTACSSNVYRNIPARDGAFGTWRTVFNGVDLAKYTCRREIAPDAPLAFLGRLEPIKGAHNAIAIAKAAGRKLVIAGNRVPAFDDYFQYQIARHLDGDRARYLGPVDDAAKSELLSRSAALLMPIEWEEPFGIVMAEAMACGTPVVGFARGSVGEVVRNGVNGYACRGIADAIWAVDHLSAIDRNAVRRDCERRFSAGVVVDQYERLYREVCGEGGAR